MSIVWQSLNVQSSKIRYLGLINLQAHRMLNKTVLILILVLIFSCIKPKKEERLVAISPENSGITFVNRISENDTINVIDFQYCYNGGGVGIGDFNKDGYPDIVFTGNQVPSRIYQNNTGLKFEDISEKSGLLTNSWVTGVVIVDINNDGLDDIYLNVAGANCSNDCDNLLFVNQGIDDDGIPHFKEQAKSYGLNDGNYSQQAVFFDYEGDGDLDVYILHNGNYGFDKNNPLPKRYMAPHLKDRLLRNDSVPGLDHSYFTDISKMAGIVHGGFGLGVAINDINNDGLVDIYVANDFITEDLVYIQKKHPDSLAPWFENRASTYLSHASHNAMGVDFADINNDTRPDILVVDMLPWQYNRQKKMLGGMNYERYLLALRNGYGSQYIRNTLQINNGALDNTPLKMSEIAFQAGISSTDWSWAPLMLDLDNDADKDIYISNGYVKDVTDLDYINYSSANNMFGSTAERAKKQKEFANKLASIHVPNFIYENLGELQFENATSSWATNTPSFTNGVAYADLDKDGDLDLVLNNINETATILENTTSLDPVKNYLRIKLIGNSKNSKGIGAKVTIWNQGRVQQQYQSVVRGYLSSMEPILHFGILGPKIDSLQVVWPGGAISRKRNITSNQIIEIHQTKAQLAPLLRSHARANKKAIRYKDLVKNYIHEENAFNEYAIQPLLMRQYSQNGPCLAVGNIDDKSGDEIFIGGSKGVPGEIFSQNAQGFYESSQKLDSVYEDTDAVFVDINGDSHLDLYITSGGTEYGDASETYEDRVYMNDGTGKFRRQKEALRASSQSTQIVRPADIDNDGDIDFFIGSRVLPSKYPNLPQSKILINEKGILTELENSGIDRIGMVSDALWEDIDDDGLLDLVVVGEWMPITVFKNIAKGFAPMVLNWTNKDKEPIETTGWWNCIEKLDEDNDGDMDFIIGNQGLNWFVRPSQKYPIYLYKNDLDQNGSPDPVLGSYYDTNAGKKLLPLHSRDDILNQLPSLKQFYLRYDDFTSTSYEKLLNIKNLGAEALEAKVFANSFAENKGNGEFQLVPLPSACQAGPVYDIISLKSNEEGKSEIFLVGNDFSGEAIYGRSDGLNGIKLEYENQDFTVTLSSDSGFYVPGHSHHIKLLNDSQGQNYILATQNKDKVKAFQFTNTN